VPLPHPDRRREPLPEQQPKATQDDPHALQAIQAILDSPSYRLAERDVDFLARDDVRGPRLQLEYLKPDTVLREHGVEHTIVVFGSTRIPEPGAARRQFETLRAEQAADPINGDLKRRLGVAERMLAKSHYYEVARQFGRLVGQASLDGTPIMVMTGGGPGMMEAANRGACDVGAKSVGLNINLPHEQFPNPYITPGLCFRFHYFALRKLHFLLRVKALVAFPGGYGTIDDYLLLTHAHLDHCGRVPLLAKQGFKGEVIATAATRELARLVMLDAAHLQEEDAGNRERARRRQGAEETRKPLYSFLTRSAASIGSAAAPCTAGRSSLRQGSVRPSSMPGTFSAQQALSSKSMSPPAG
jgi:predicted Rossmann-fold nucleotide-binding protein